MTNVRRTAASFLVLALITLLPTCVQESPENGGEMEMQDSLSYLALGDSYTIGESVPEEDRWPVQLTHRLRDLGLPLRDPLIVARTGWTTDELVQGIQEAGVPGTWDLVTLLIGVNNQYRGRSVDNFREEFVGLLGQAVDFAGGSPDRVVVLSIPDWGVMPFAEGRDREEIAAEIDAFNQAARLETERAGASWVDVTPGSRLAAEDPALVAGDGLHPSGAMYSRWVDEALPAVREILAARGRERGI